MTTSSGYFFEGEKSFGLIEHAFDRRAVLLFHDMTSRVPTTEARELGGHVGELRVGRRSRFGRANTSVIDVGEPAVKPTRLRVRREGEAPTDQRSSGVLTRVIALR